MNDSPLVFFSIEDARKLVAERNRLLHQYEEINRKVQALAVLVPDNMREKIFGTSVAALPSTGPVQPGLFSEPLSLRDVVIEIVDEVAEVIEQDDLEKLVWLRPGFSDQNVYTPVEIAKQLERAARNGQIGKRGTRYYSRKIEAPSDGSIGNEGPTIISVTEKVLRQAEESLEAWEVVDRMKKHPDVADSAKLRPNAVYAALSRLVARRVAHRDVDGGYRIGAR